MNERGWVLHIRKHIVRNSLDCRPFLPTQREWQHFNVNNTHQTRSSNTTTTTTTCVVSFLPMVMFVALYSYDNVLLVLLLALSQLGWLPISHGFRSGTTMWSRNPQFLGSGRNTRDRASSSHPIVLWHQSEPFRQAEGLKYGARYRRMMNKDDPSSLANARTTVLDTIHLTNHSNATTSTATEVWNPLARIIMATLASVGAIETGYLTFIKMTQGSLGLQTLCSSTVDDSSHSCNLALDSPYATIGGIPLTFYGFCAYSVVIILSLFPLLSHQQTKEPQKLLTSPNNVSDMSQKNLDYNNRITLLSVTTCMATFSIYLLSILIFVLQANCPFCILSAILSISLGFISWLGGAADAVNNNNNNSNSNSLSATQVLPDPQSTVQSNTAQAISNELRIVPPSFFGLSSFVITTIATAALYGTIFTSTLPPTAYATYNSPPTVRQQQQQEVAMELAPPPISATSNERALLLSTELQNLNTRFFGAYWCSHCYEQKERLGKEAMTKIPYIECSREGKNSQAELCKARKIPGYPTWEINSQLFPGERTMDELEDIVLLLKEQQQQNGMLQK